jgi:hypothetical protein
MGTVIHQNGIQISINSKENQHRGRPHCHVDGRGGSAVIDLVTFEEMRTRGYSPRDMKQILELIKTFHDQLTEEWEKFHGKK